MLGIILVLAVPGATKLFFKMLERGKYAGLNMPDPVRKSFVYLDPTPVLTGLPKIVPPRTAAWVGSLVQQNSDARHLASHRWLQAEPPPRPSPGPTTSPIADADTGTRGESIIGTRGPIITGRKDVQLVSFVPSDEGMTLGLIVWNRRALPRLGAFSVTIDTDAGPREAQVTYAQRYDMPNQVRIELKEFGYILPPPTVIWLSATVPDVQPADVRGLSFAYDDGEGNRFGDETRVIDLK